MSVVFSKPLTIFKVGIVLSLKWFFDSFSEVRNHLLDKGKGAFINQGTSSLYQWSPQPKYLILEVLEEFYEYEPYFSMELFPIITQGLGSSPYVTLIQCNESVQDQSYKTFFLRHWQPEADFLLICEWLTNELYMGCEWDSYQLFWYY